MSGNKIFKTPNPFLKFPLTGNSIISPEGEVPSLSFPISESTEPSFRELRIQSSNKPDFLPARPFLQISVTFSLTPLHNSMIFAYRSVSVSKPSSYCSCIFSTISWASSMSLSFLSNFGRSPIPQESPLLVMNSEAFFFQSSRKTTVSRCHNIYNRSFTSCFNFPCPPPHSRI
jgi:hypothetical protein